MPGDGTELISNQAAVVAPFAPASNEPQLGDDELVHAPADQAAEAAVLQSELGSDPADEGQTEHSEPESALDGANTGNYNAQEAVATQPDADPRSALEKQPYECEKCTIQVAIQLLPNDGDAKGRPVLIGVRSHLDAPIVQMLRLDELGLLPPAITALIEQLKAELPARAQAAGQLAAKAKEQAERKTPTVKASDKRGKTPLAKRDQAPAPAPQPSVLTDEQRANAVALVTTDDKQQLAMF